jgi:glycosyltransferase involved in cell wall biosynthesis
MTDIDIIVPTNGSPLDVRYILDLPMPQGIELNFYIVVDRQLAGFSAPSGLHIKVVQSKGSGASAARNTGIEAGSGELILFIDDDVIPSQSLIESYMSAIQKWPDSIGLVGLTKLPEPANSFERGVVASDILTFQGIAKSHPMVSWGVTANLLVRRDGLGPVRFSQSFPRHGGGEDIDFCLRLVQRAGKKFRSVPDAVVEHPWWNNGSRQYKRFARWAFGDSRLPAMYPEYKYRNYPNMTEAAFLAALTLAIGGLIEPRLVVGVAYGVLLAFLIECAAQSIRSYRRGIGVRAGVEAALVRLSNEFGRIAGNLSRGHITGFLERFDYFTTGESIPYERKVARNKFVIFILGISAFLVLIS